MLVIEILLLVYFTYVISYATTFTLASFTYKNPKTNPVSINRYAMIPRFCVLIPAYKEDDVILGTAQKSLIQSYPPSCFEIVIIADSLKPETLNKLGMLPVRVVEVSFESSTKVKALNSAMEQLPDHYDYGVILDADNVMVPDFIEKLAALFLSSPHKAIQGQRKPKNQQTTVAFLDGISEAINNTIYRQGTSAAGLSASISGSGFAVEYQLLKRQLKTMDSIGGFDRELELLLLRDGIKVHYVKELVVYDEKVAHGKNFQNQRRRWISSQYVYLAKYFREGMRSLFQGDLVFFNSAILRNVQLPRLINIGLLFIVTCTLFFFRSALYFSYSIWPLLFLIFGLVTFAAIPGEYYTYRMLYAIMKLPVLFGRMISALMGLKSANKKFIHTPHQVSNAPAKS